MAIKAVMHKARTAENCNPLQGYRSMQQQWFAPPALSSGGCMICCQSPEPITTTTLIEINSVLAWWFIFFDRWNGVSIMEKHQLCSYSTAHSDVRHFGAYYRQNGLGRLIDCWCQYYGERAYTTCSSSSLMGSWMVWRHSVVPMWQPGNGYSSQFQNVLKQNSHASTTESVFFWNHAMCLYQSTQQAGWWHLPWPSAFISAEGPLYVPLSVPGLATIRGTSVPSSVSWRELFRDVL